jgi:hypothetical protein
LPKKRFVKVAMKLPSMKRPNMASMAARMAIGSLGLCTGWKKPRPWNETTLRRSAFYQGNA